VASTQSYRAWGLNFPSMRTFYIRPSQLSRMITHLSAEGSRLKMLCDSIATAVSASIQAMIDTPEGGEMVAMGADGTPTKSIDRAAEKAVFSRLSSCGMGFRVLSEEKGEVQIGDEQEYFLALDPLDGTFNAIKGIPFYSLSLFFSKEGVHFGYICDLPRGVRYYAEAGGGAYVEPGSKRLSVSKTSEFRDYSISAYTIRPHTGRIAAVGDRVRRIRTLGSASLEMALVAAGKLDAFVDLRGMLRVVDVAAGKLILEEAGGIITDAEGNLLELNGDMWQKTDLIGSNGLMHEDLIRLIGGDAH
jgi:fructose-1,6-bisphosphatase/inositol monophosphatase family enzyme